MNDRMLQGIIAYAAVGLFADVIIVNHYDYC